MKKYIGFVIYNALMILVSILLLSIDKNTLIVYLGINMADIVQIGVWVVIILAFILGNVLLILRRLKARTAVRTAIPAVKFSAKETISPEEIRRELSQYKDLGPNLNHYVSAVFTQMDSMNRKQVKLKHIFEKNQIDTLVAVETAITQAEQAICRNVVKIHNRIILWDPQEWNKAGKENIYAQHRTYIERHIEINEDILSKCDILLSETVDYVNEKDTGNQSGQFHLEIMTETMQTLRNMNRTEDESL